VNAQIECCCGLEFEEGELRREMFAVMMDDLRWVKVGLEDGRWDGKVLGWKELHVLHRSWKR